MTTLGKIPQKCEIVLENTTENPLENPGQITLEAQGTTWGEFTLDGSLTAKIGKNVGTLISGNYFKFDQIIDNNNDGFTDLTLQDRFSIFNHFLFMLS